MRFIIKNKNLFCLGVFCLRFLFFLSSFVGLGRGFSGLDVGLGIGKGNAKGRVIYAIEGAAGGGYIRGELEGFSYTYM